MLKLNQLALSKLAHPSKLDNWFKSVRNFRDNFAFARCRLCGHRVLNYGLCNGCANDLPVLGRRLSIPDPNVRLLWGGFRYAFPIDRLIAEAKYHGGVGTAKLLGHLLFRQLEDRADELPELLIPIPMPWPRLLNRGYNQAQILANEIGRRLNIPVRTDVLLRKGWQPPQRGLSAQQRAQNLRGVLRLKTPIAGRRIAIIDDVYTTGATTRAAASVLTRAGAESIEIWVIAVV
jgi:ComF family protein